MGQMKPLPEFFQGSIAQDFPGILHVDDAPDVCKGKKSPKIPPNTSRPQCTNAQLGTNALLACKEQSPCGPQCTNAQLGTNALLACKEQSPCGPANTARPQCTNRMPCTQKSPSSPPNTKRPPCTRVRDLCHKKKKAADAFVPGAEGWSIPPAPPVF